MEYLPWQEGTQSFAGLSYLPCPDNLVFRRSELRQREGATAMELLRADAHLGTEAEFTAIGETGGGVPIDSGGIDSAEKPPRSGFIARDDGIGMLC